MYVSEFGDVMDFGDLGRIRRLRPSKSIAVAAKNLQRAILMATKLGLPKDKVEQLRKTVAELKRIRAEIIRPEREAIKRTTAIAKKLIVAAEQRCKPGAVTVRRRERAPIRWIRRR